MCVVYSTHNDATSDQVINSLRSVLSQKYPSFHVVIADRGSTDQTIKLINTLLKEHPQYRELVEVLRLETDSEAEAYLRGLRECQVGDVAVLIDAQS